MPGEAGTDDANDGVFLVVEFEDLAEDVGTGGEVGLPERVADDGYRGRSYTLGSFGRGKDPAHERRRVQELKAVAGHLQYLDRLRYLAIGGDHACIVLREDGFDRFGLAKLVDFSEGKGNVAAAALLVLNGDESDAIGVAIGVGVDQDSVEDAVDGCGGSDAERHGKNRGEGVDAMPGELPESKGNVSEHPELEHDASTLRANLRITRVRGNQTAN